MLSAELPANLVRSCDALCTLLNGRDGPNSVVVVTQGLRMAGAAEIIHRVFDSCLNAIFMYIYMFVYMTRAVRNGRRELCLSQFDPRGLSQDMILALL